MGFFPIGFALLVALALTALLALLTERESGLAALIPAFLILFLFPWAGGLWLAPVGPALFGFAWVPILVVAGILFFVLLVASPPRKSRVHREQVRRKRRELRAQQRMRVLVALLLVGGIALIALGYAMQ